MGLERLLGVLNHQRGLPAGLVCWGLSPGDAATDATDGPCRVLGGAGAPVVPQGARLTLISAVSVSPGACQFPGDGPCLGQVLARLRFP